MSLMREEALFAADAVANQARAVDTAVLSFLEKKGQNAFHSFLTVARGSSDHAAHYLAYLAMQRLGMPTVSLPMSIMTLHQAAMQVKGVLAFGFSQSGQSPDLVETMKALKAQGAATMSFVNKEGSPLEATCDYHVPICAGEEKSVAATKSYITLLSAAARFVAHYAQDKALLSALDRLPDDLRAASQKDWGAAIPLLKDAKRAFIIGRGLSFPIALEAALKCKETCTLQAEAFSSAEVKHGPMALIDEGYPLLVFAPASKEQAGIVAFAEEMRQRGAHVLLAAPSDIKERDLEIASSAHEALNPILAIQSFYLMVDALSQARGLNPDVPRFLSKVTKTL